MALQVTMVRKGIGFTQGLKAAMANGTACARRCRYQTEAPAEQKRARELLTQSRELLKQMQAPAEPAAASRCMGFIPQFCPTAQAPSHGRRIFSSDRIGGPLETILGGGQATLRSTSCWTGTEPTILIGRPAHPSTIIMR